MLKYANDFEKIKKFQSDEEKVKPDWRDQNFDLEKAFDGGLLGSVSQKFAGFFLKFLIKYSLKKGGPVRVPFLGLILVTKYDQVVKILGDAENFKVPFGPEMSQMTGGVNFALGDDGILHERQRPVMIEALHKQVSFQVISETAARVGNALLDDAGGEIDAVGDYLARTTAEICRKVYGIECSSSDDFAQYSMAGSALLFADPNGRPEYREQAMIGGRQLRGIMNQNIDRIMRSGNFTENGVLGELIGVALNAPERLTGEVGDVDGAMGHVRAMMFGLITGFIPTNALAAGNILGELSRRPEEFSDCIALARKWAEAEDEAEKSKARSDLSKYLMEAARLKPALDPGQFRVVEGEAASEMRQAFSGFRFSDGDTLLACTAASLRDPARFSKPDAFKPFRDEFENGVINLLFGYGSHSCIGEHIAKEVITDVFIHLLARPEIAFLDEKLVNVGPIPWSMKMTYRVERGQLQRSMVTSSIALSPDADAEEVINLLCRLNADSAFKTALHESGILHFGSFNVVNIGSEIEPEYRFLVELSADGTQNEAIDRIFQSGAGAFLDRLEPYLAPGEKTPAAPKAAYNGVARSPLNRMVIAHAVSFHTLPWGAMGVNFPGAGEFSADQIDQEQALFNHVRPMVEALSNKQVRSNEMMEQIRAHVASGPFAHLLYRPKSRFPEFVRRHHTPFNTFIQRYFSQPAFKWAAFGILGFASIVGLLLLFWASTALFALPYFVALIFFPLIVLALGLGVFFWRLRRHETVLEEPDDRFGDQEALQRILDGENVPGCVQNHLTSVSEIKPGFLRLLTTALSFHVIKMMVVLWFKRGFVTDFATIHYAKWFRLPGTRKLIFQTNYDGSWESYLEDFITKVHGGQTIAWNNAVGFPKTNWLFLDGAEDGDQFKRWVRRQQVETLCWFSRNPTLTTGNIRTNALVRDGLARAASRAECEAWKKLFNSAQRHENALETEQIQTLVFNGMARHPYAAAYLVKFENAEAAGRWLRLCLTDQSYNVESPLENGRRQGLAFGDGVPDQFVRFVGFSAAGLKFLGLKSDDNQSGINTFPAPFVSGMKSRWKVLDDDRNSLDDWLWHDGSAMDALANDEKACHAILMHYARTEHEFGELAEDLKAEAETYAFTARQIDFAPLTGGAHKEPFGFRDGVSQPVMTGTKVFAMGKHSPDDVVSPGEFLMGYHDTRGHFPISPQVGNDHRHLDLLPPLHEAYSPEEPWFDPPGLTSFRDIGRNGSFLCVRQLAQDVDRFHAFASDFSKLAAPPRIAGHLRLPPEDAGLESSVGESEVKMEWFKAKMFGRWPDGSSLARNPVQSKTRRNRAQAHDSFLKLLGERVASDVISEDQQKALLAILSKYEMAPKFAEPEVAQMIAEAIAARGGAEGLITPFEVVWGDEAWEMMLTDIEAVNALGVTMPVASELLRAAEPDNDFRHGSDDPQGNYCPLGSHVRRANPRDSFSPGSETILTINNRHRLLRRGRTFLIGKDSEPAAAGGRITRLTGPDGALDRGTFFCCFNANIERQFEFVQQTWINSRVFHDGRNAPDPLISPKREGDRFVIQSATAAHVTPLDGEDGKTMADFVKVQGGGYFFFPGLEALQFLAALARSEKTG